MALRARTYVIFVLFGWGALLSELVAVLILLNTYCDHVPERAVGVLWLVAGCLSIVAVATQQRTHPKGVRLLSLVALAVWAVGGLLLLIAVMSLGGEE